MIHKKTLDNGFRVVAEQLPHFRSVTVGIWAGVGSAKETPEENGLSHFIEHMIFKGTDERSAKQIAAEMDAIGGQMNAFTSKESTCYYAKVMDNRIKNAIDILSDIYLHSVMDPKEIEKEKKVVLEEIAMVEDTPDDLIHDLLSGVVFKGHPLSKTILGPKENVAAFQRDDLKSYMDRYYSSENTVISAAGNLDPKELFDIVEEYFGGKKRDTHAPFKLPEAHAKKGEVFREKEIEQIHLCYGLPGFAWNTQESYALNIINNVFGGSMSSRLFQSIREERGLAYSVYSYPSAYSQTGMFTIYLGTMPKNVKLAEEIVCEQIELLKKEGITQQEMAQGKEQLRSSYLLGQESTSSRMLSLGKGEVLMGRILSEEEIVQQIEGVTMQDIEEVIPFVFDEAAISKAMVGKVSAIK
ncbi:MAG: M16 family metallopeptidase [Christensenellales bacterium]|jgi:predicted Zn-dependent peptidase